jgi:uncharacterized protein involved in exopolysaccharide biosynthesis
MDVTMTTKDLITIIAQIVALAAIAGALVQRLTRFETRTEEVLKRIEKELDRLLSKADKQQELETKVSVIETKLAAIEREVDHMKTTPTGKSNVTAIGSKP